jgi:dephospho-CoA kinase
LKLLGLTGGVGMGKTAADSLLRQRGIPVVDTDLLARELVEPGEPALAQIQLLFGTEIIGSDGRLRRDELARRVFADASARQKLEDILHPLIRAAWQRQVEVWRSEARPIGVIVIPLLFETKATSHFDATVCVACTPGTQRERLSARGWSPTQIEQRIAAQMPIEEKVAAADYVIWTEADLTIHARQLDRILSHLPAR